MDQKIVVIHIHQNRGVLAVARVQTLDALAHRLVRIGILIDLAVQDDAPTDFLRQFVHLAVADEVCQEVSRHQGRIIAG
ncbi:MAG: hypothetical protein IPO07_23245 [Haliscomenobacter sp.]|nr:hypothetical protein [Haliscomenobacter sp.]